MGRGSGTGSDKRRSPDRPPLDSDRSTPHLPHDSDRSPPTGATRAATFADRCPPGLARSARAQDALPRADARVGDQPARPADLRRRARGQPGVALSGAAAAGEGGADHERVGHHRQQPPRPLLPPDRVRTACTGQGARELAPLRRRPRGGPALEYAMSWVKGFRARLGLLLGGQAAESRAQEEFRFHIEMEAERLVRENGLPPDEARRRALAAFGGVQNHRESMRDGRGLAWLSGLSLDLKLGVRMLIKYPGLTIVGGLAMAFAIWVGVVVFEMLMLFMSPR